MMTRLASNALVFWFFGLLAFYVVAAVIVPWPYFSAFFAAAQMIAGLIVFGGWVPDAYKVAKDRDIDGSHLALLGVTLLAAGSSYSGTFGLLWALAGQPTYWTGTPYSTLGRAFMTAGFVLLIISPDATKEGIRPPRWYIVAAGVVAVAAIAFVLGLNWAPPPS